MKSNGEGGTLRKGRVAFFVTSNVHKFHEARVVLSKYDIAAAMLNVEAVEIQDDDVKNIALASVIDAASRSGLPVFVEDAGLFVNALKGFPGPYSSYVYRTVGTRGILRLLDAIKQRDAYFRSVVAFRNPEEKRTPMCFEGKVKGKVSIEERGKNGFGFDPIFEPSGGSGLTFAEMSTEEKNRFSHRAQALRKFAAWYTQRC